MDDGLRIKDEGLRMRVLMVDRLRIKDEGLLVSNLIPYSFQLYPQTNLIPYSTNLYSVHKTFVLYSLLLLISGACETLVYHYEKTCTFIPCTIAVVYGWVQQSTKR